MELWGASGGTGENRSGPVGTDHTGRRTTGSCSHCAKGTPSAPSGQPDVFSAFYKNLLVTITPIPDVIQKQKTAWDNVKSGIKGYLDKFDEVKELKAVGSKVAKGLEDAFVNMAMGVKTSFKDMARAILADLVRIQIRKTLLNVLPSHTGTAEVKHTGGSIGAARIPSFHTGVRSDERLAKLQVGEAVVNRAGAAKNRASIDAMNAGYSVGGQGGGVTTAEINFNVQAIDAKSFNSYLVNNRGTIEGIINSSLTSNGSVRRTIKQVI